MRKSEYIINNEDIKNKSYKDLDLPNANKYCSPRILELYVHPPVNQELIEKTVSAINDLFKI